MEFEDLLKKVGGFGRYQWKLVIIFLIPAIGVLPWFNFGLIFLASTPDHWCYVPQVVQSSNLTLTQQQAIVRPQSDPSCSRYDINYTAFLHSGNFTIDPEWPTKPCDNGWQYDTTRYDATAATRWNMVCQSRHYGSLVLSLVFVGDVLGTPVYGFIADKLGRRPTFFILAVITALSDIGSVLVPNFTAFLVLRAINGSVMSTIYQVAYIVALELVSPSKRAAMNGVATTSWAIGLCLLPLLAWLTRNWIKLSIVTSTTILVMLFVFWKILPESPSWLLSLEKYEDAAVIMDKISKENGKDIHKTGEMVTHLQRLSDTMQKKKLKESTYSPLDLVRYPHLRRKFILVTVCWIGNSVSYFGLQMNVQNLSGNEFINFFLISLVEIPSHLATWVFMERLGRRWCSVSAFLLGGVSCLLPVLFSSNVSFIGILASLLGKFGASSAFMTLYQQGPELYPTPLRGMGLGMSSSIATITTLTVPYIVYLGLYGKEIPFLVFAAISLLGAVCAAFLPETINRNLPQTIADAEVFGINEKFFSCGRNERNSTCSKIQGSLSITESIKEPPEELSANFKNSMKAQKILSKTDDNMKGNVGQKHSLEEDANLHI